MVKRIFVLLFLTIFSIAFVNAQADDARLKEITSQLKKDGEKWVKGGAMGLDLSQLALINPKVGAGENRLAFGAITSTFANYKNDKISWENLLSWQMAVQRLGASENPFTKNIDLLRFGTKASYKLKGKWNGAIIGTFESLLLKTYNDNSLSSNDNNKLQAAFLSPATISLSPGIDYKYNENLSIFLSPASYKSILVMNDDIAKLGVHGNPWRSETDFDNIKNEMGANLIAVYKNTFAKKLGVSSNLNLFYDYFGEQGLDYVDVIFINNFSYEFIKGLSLNLLLDTRWDKDIKSITGYDNTGAEILEDNKWMITEALFIKYTKLF